MRIVIINGPNLNLLGVREPAIYGSCSFENYLVTLRQRYPAVDFDYFQSNVEGVLVNIIQSQGFTADGLILNAGGYTHTSVAIADAVAAVPAPVVEVHISNVFKREIERHRSLLSAVVIGTIGGFGLDVYRLAVEALIAMDTTGR